MFLDYSTFSKVIDSAPLVSIDLVILNENNQALLGERLNKPAQGSWFVPGGRILKNESLAKAFERLTTEELGEVFTISEATLLGPFDHFYDENVFGDSISTHYVALAYILRLNKQLTDLPHNIQHGKYKWFDTESLLIDKKVHKHTKWYFEALQNTQG
ncbi:GDP-mannose mannosyl hydrolase [Pseudoalteromonas luteoviolacea]|uniref:GDP-mannose mannosyl hydrolase NudD n=1 Tax=Pseudoalteromonas luteoviolacea H33 TaxID=1365251 RepID=A0A167EZA6_9GAMM|nr:GDP-mannose mannosyl hydrolase [Pseudoalteromonas luteoviolacea]KZN51393.1 GDP-mannose mannosyl hydrolase NudD [Pseudoalteromonas luteoviolacea H33]KZN71436.1 GDP-mannose mannosyl hydrolase NudD [Pseudoalteromonas luteoviolacea H33-S]MBQ4876791.1 GDP-mannose mannosyl hydrolase [Pseudoalteromonas luteoviolacea]MBQ4905420.1 GDP-mannose mannosyl hydrolase [Pseudoalteromonas luteoviolacea]